MPQTPIADVYEAEDRSMEVPISYIESGYPQLAIPILKARLKIHPQDSIARVWFARALADQRDINNAITQYKYVLSTALPDTELQDVCIQGLLELRAIPVEIASDYVEQRNRFQIIDNGRRLRVVDPNYKNQDQQYQYQPDENQQNTGFAASPQQSVAGVPGGPY